MSVRLVHRPARLSRPLGPPEQDQLAPPPQVGEQRLGGFPVQALLPVLGAGTSVVMILVYRGSSNPLFLLVGAVLLAVALIGGLVFALSQRGSAARQRRVQRERYLDYLERTRFALRRRAARIRDDASLVDPEPAALLELIRDPARLWERRRSHADFLRVRIGEGEVRSFDLSLPGEQNPVQPYDPILAGEAREVIRQHGVVHGMPVTVALEDAGSVAVIGDRADALAIARSIVAQLAALHAPDDVHLAVAFSPEHESDWSAVSRLPHAIDEELRDGPVAARRIARSTTGLLGVIGGALADRAQAAATAKRTIGPSARADGPRLVVILDDWGHVASSLPLQDADLRLADLRVTTVHILSDRLHEPSDVTLRITAADGVASVTDARAEDGEEPSSLVARIDATPPQLLEAITRTLAPLRLSASRREEVETAESIDIRELLGIADLDQVTAQRAWAERSPRDFLRIPIGLDDFGSPVLLDLKESAQLGMGPHGICIGATGSGKSELLRTLVLGLAATHSPEDLAMVLVDFKGGAAFAPFQGLPHVAGIIDNLADDPQMTERARASIQGEVVRRQELLRDAGSAPSIAHYRELRRDRPELPPLPHLFIVIDEFGELLAAEPEFVDLLLTIGRIGRSIGVHLLLSSQRIEAGRLRGLDTYLSYRIGLRTFSEAESAVVLDTPDAYHLPAVPGYGYLKVDTTVYRRFRAGYVSGAVDEGAPADAIATERPRPLILPPYNGLAEVDEHDDPGEAVLERPRTGRSLLDAVAERLASESDAVAPVWLPPLPSRLTLGRIIDGAGADPLRPPIGLLDAPSEQTQNPWHLDLTSAGGHVAFIGAPQSGRTTALRTLAVSLALSGTPRQVSIYGMDLAGGGLGRLEGFPHVGGVATRSSHPKLRRLADELTAMLAAREQVFREHGIDSLAALRERHAAGDVPELVAPDVVLLLDGTGALRTEFEDLEAPITELLQRGGGYGIHVVLAMTRWNELRMAQQPLIGTRIELRLNDAGDSVIGRRLARTIRAEQQGRALTEQERFGQIALPVLDDVDDAAIPEALAVLAARSATSWSGPGASPIRLLPSVLHAGDLPDAIDEPDRIPWALRQDTMAPALLDTARDQHLVAYGDAQSGRSTVLRGIIAGFIDRATPDELVVALMDIRGSIAGTVPDDFLGGHASNAIEARQLAAAVAEELAKRQSGDRSSGPRIVVVVDDYDIVASGGTEPLHPLLPYLPAARDLRLHVLLTRPVAGAARAVYDPVLSALRDTGGSTLVMSGERSEGQLLPGVFAEPMPPGRGRFIRRGERPVIVQAAIPEPKDAER